MATESELQAFVLVLQAVNAPLVRVSPVRITRTGTGTRTGDTVNAALDSTVF